MLKLLLLITSFIALISSAFAQTVFESGYYINNSEQRIEGLIKNADWKYNPSSIQYKSSTESKPISLNIDDVQEFGIEEKSKYVRKIVRIDKSGNALPHLSESRNPDFQNDTLLLRVEVEGKVTLYSYTEGSLQRFFYQKTDREIEQLVYKPYQNNNTIYYNNSFRQQLKLNLSCNENTTLNPEQVVDYSTKSLTRYFVKYHECINSDFTIYEKVKDQNYFRLSVRPGINYTSMNVYNKQSSNYYANFESKINGRLGLEAEIILPFNNNKWSVLIEPTYQYFHESYSREEPAFSGGTLLASFDYQSIELPIGIRHYFFLNDHSQLFLNAGIIADISINSKVKFERENGTEASIVNVGAKPNFFFGAGYKMKERYSLEFRYLTNRQLFNEYVFWASEYETLSLIFGIRLF